MELNKAPATVQMDVMSRYRNTRLYIDATQTVFFGTWKAPDIRQFRQPTIYTVSPEELRRPDLIAYRVYGDPSLFWAIAARNNIFMPLKDIQVGQVLVCPHMDDVSAALTRASEVSAGTP
mgnify:CR=1 FL=1